MEATPATVSHCDEESPARFYPKQHEEVFEPRHLTMIDARGNVKGKNGLV